MPLATTVVSHDIEYGEEPEPSAPMGDPSSLNWIPVTPISSEAVAMRVALVPVSVAPAEGTLMETEGGVVSAVRSKVCVE